jgi:predicted exporter
VTRWPVRLWPVGLWLLGLIVSVLIILHTPFAADMSAFLPRSANPAQGVLVDQLKDGAASRIMLIGIEGAPSETLAALSKALAAKLRADPKIGLVNNGEDLGQSADQNYLWENRYLLSPGTRPERFTAPGLKAALQDDLDRLGTPMGLILKESLPADPTGALLGLLDLFAGGTHPASRDGVWVSPDGARAIILVQSHEAAFDIDAQARILSVVHAGFEAAKSTVPGSSAARLLVTGPPVFAISARAQIRHDVSRLSMIATALVATVLLIAYRSPLLLGLSLLPVASGVLAGIAVVSLGFGFVHGITLGFGVTLIGEAVDYAIYLFSRTEPGSTPETTLARIWPTLRLGLMTSLAGFGAMLFSGFPGFVQLGLFTMTGLIAAASVTRFVLPHLLPGGFGGVSLARAEPVLERVLAFVPRLRLPLALLLASALAILFLHQGSYWEDQLSSMNPVPAGQLALDRDLRADLGAPDVRYMIVLDAPDQETALARSSQLAAGLEPLVGEGVLVGFDSPDRYLPSAATQAARRAAIPDAEILRANLAEATAGLPFRPDTFAPFLADTAKAKASPPLTRAQLQGSALALKLDSSLFKHGASTVAILQLRGVSDAKRLGTALSALNVPGATLLDLKSESDALLSRYLGEAQILSLAGSLAVTLLLVIALRSAVRALRVLAPLAAAVAITAAILLLAGHQLSVFNLFGLLLSVAVGSNYCLFFERGEAEGGRARLLASLVLANICTVIGFGVLSFSGVPVLHGIGMTVAIGTGLSLLFGAVLIAPRRA